jgi:putative alpha-1,2-mannosidase
MPGSVSVVLGILLYMVAAVTAVEHPEEFVNLLAGSFTDGNSFSTGNTLPLVGMPWAFNHWSPQTREDNRNVGSWWFNGNDHTFTWIRCTHQPSPWIGDWGHFLVSPQLGGRDRNVVHFWEPRAANLKPYLFDATVAPHAMRIQLAPTMHGAILRVTFPPERFGKYVCFAAAQVLLVNFVVSSRLWSNLLNVL